MPTLTSYGNLLCPACKRTHTHIDAVVLGCRTEDADPKMLFIEMDTGEVLDDKTPDDPPSARRSWVELLVYCEDCGANSRVVFAQHKGQTKVTARPE